MRGIAAKAPSLLFLLLFLVAAVPSAAGPDHAPAICGKEDYPSPDAYATARVENATLWESFRAAGGFASGTEGTGSLEFWVTDGALVHVVRIGEMAAAPSGPYAIAVSVRDENAGGQEIATYAFRTIEVGRLGGNLTLVAWVAGGGLEIFWRWAYLACDEQFPLVYFVYHGRVEGGAIADDNTEVYFEAVRPRRGPPTDLILVIVAGAAASTIFLYARRALKKRPPESDSRDHTVK